MVSFLPTQHKPFTVCITEDKEKFIMLGRALKEAGFTVQVHEDNGINFKVNLKE